MPDEIRQQVAWLRWDGAKYHVLCIKPGCEKYLENCVKWPIFVDVVGPYALTCDGCLGLLWGNKDMGTLFRSSLNMPSPQEIVGHEIVPDNAANAANLPQTTVHNTASFYSDYALAARDNIRYFRIG
jgi:hypothetical protein